MTRTNPLRGRPTPARSFLASVASALLLLIDCGCAAVIPPSTLPISARFEVEATIAGEGVKLVLDTGSNHSLLKTEAAQRLELDDVPTGGRAVSMTDSSNEVRQVGHQVRIVDLRLGATTWDDFVVPCLPVSARFGWDGILGMNVLRPAAWWFDVAAGIVHILPPEGLEEHLLARGQRVLARLPLGADPLRPFVRVRLEGQLDVELLLDTGAGSTSLPREVVEALDLPAGDELAQRRAEQEAAEWQAAFARAGLQATVRVTPSDGSSIGVHEVERKASLHHLRRLDIGQRRFDDLLITGDEGRLGRDVLGKMPWVLHGPRGELWMLGAP
ncbi:MAG TPA: aspartyl protease family protein [Planctomycetota bacterium]